MTEEELNKRMNRWMTRAEIRECAKYLKEQGKTVYSISRLDSYTQCKYGYYRTYILGEYGGDSCYSYIGSQVHEHLEKIYKNEEAVEEMQEKLPKQMNLAKLFYPFPSQSIEKKYISDLELFAKNFVKQDYHKIYCERGFIIKVGKSYVQGYIDATIVNEDGSIDIIDYKTSSAYSSESIREHANQLLLYALAVKQIDGVIPKSVKWYMLKYVSVTDKNGRKKEATPINRSTLVKDLSSKIKTNMKKLGCENEMLLNMCIKENDMSALPKEIQDRFIIEECYVGYPITEETMTEMYDYITGTIAEIEARDKNNTRLWQPKAKSDFFCENLCSHYDKCYGRQ